MNKVIITGGNGLVGSRIVELLSPKYEFERASRETGINITKKDDVLNLFKESKASIIIHLAAKADVDGCESDKEKDQELLNSGNYDWEDSNTAYGVNVYGTKNVVEAAAQTGKKIIYISTDFVFDGKKTDPYVEEDSPNPLNWYAKTKYLGEEEVKRSPDFIIARPAYPYRSSFEKKDFVRSIMFRFQENQKINAVKDHIMTPTFIDDIAFSLDTLMQRGDSGIYHVVGSSFVSPIEAAKKIADVFGFDKNLISETTREEYFKNKAERPFHLALQNAKIANLGISMKTFDQGLLELKKTL